MPWLIQNNNLWTRGKEEENERSHSSRIKLIHQEVRILAVDEDV
jgi:hypothetical protein